MDSQEIRLYSGLVISAVSLALLLIIFLISIVKQQKKLLKVQRENRFIEMKAVERERTRIANDLHDELSPMVAAVKMGVNHLDITKEQDILLVNKTNKTLDDISAELREIAFDLMPSALQKKGLLAAVEEFSSHINRTNSLKIRLLMPEKLNLDEEKTIHIYRIIQEIFHNTIKHSGATELKLRLYREKENLVITTIDNGKGFEYEKKMKSSVGLGLKSMEGRVELLNGELMVDSKINIGTSYTIIIPN